MWGRGARKGRVHGVIRALAHSPVAFEVKRGVSWFEAFAASLSEPPNPLTTPMTHNSGLKFLPCNPRTISLRPPPPPPPP